MATGNGNGNSTKGFGDDLGLDGFEPSSNPGGNTNNGSVNLNSPYKVYGTNEPYNGLTVKIGGYHYTTDEGTLQGDSVQLVPIGFSDDLGLDDFSPNSGGNVNNPVTRTFISRVVYYRQNGSQVRVGSKLHQHKDGQIMLGHDPNNMGAIVTRIRPKGFGDDLGLDGFEPSNMGGNTSRVTNPNPTTSGNTGTNPGGMGGRRRTSGGGGGGY